MILNKSNIYNLMPFLIDDASPYLVIVEKNLMILKKAEKIDPVRIHLHYQSRETVVS